MRRCATCKRPLVVRSGASGPDDPRIDCGGDCLWCVYEAEEGAPPEYRATRPRGWPDDRQLVDLVQAEVLAAGKLKQLDGAGIGWPSDASPGFTQTGRSGWLFFWDSVAHQTSRHPSDSLAGNSPIVVLRNGSVEQFGTSPPAIAEAEAAID
jgi:hypothetical protein